MPGNSTSCHVYDFTAPAAALEADGIKTVLRAYCKKWCFQKERGATGYEHFQGRISLKNKTNSGAATAKQLHVTGWHFTVTSTANRDNNFYVTKEEGRLDGPWHNTDKIIYLPRQFRGMEGNLYPFQQKILDERDNFEARRVNLVYDAKGNKGKSTIASYMDCMGYGIDMPPVNDGEKLISALCDIVMATDDRTPGVIFMDLPRALDQKKLSGMFTAIEQIKKGKLYDFRYSYKTFWIDSPQIWVFCNWLPDTTYLSVDRWKVWNINETKEFVEMSAVDQALVFRQQRQANMEIATPVADGALVVAPPVIEGPGPDDTVDDIHQESEGEGEVIDLCEWTPVQDSMNLDTVSRALDQIYMNLDSVSAALDQIDTPALPRILDAGARFGGQPLSAA
jgi:hypothetical protein